MTIDELAELRRVEMIKGGRLLLKLKERKSNFLRKETKVFVHLSEIT